MEKKVNSFYDLETWKEAHKLVIEIYKITKQFPSDERFGLIDQMRRAVSSITANIAEGFTRFHYKDKVRFYYQSRGSIGEVQNFLILSRDLGYISKLQCKELGEKSINVMKLINGLIRATSRQNAIPR